MEAKYSQFLNPRSIRLLNLPTAYHGTAEGIKPTCVTILSGIMRAHASPHDAYQVEMFKDQQSGGFFVRGRDHEPNVSRD